VAFTARDRRGTLDHAFTTGFAKRRGRRVVDAETQRRYSRTFLLLSEHLGRPAELADLTARRAAEFLTWLANDRGMADWTVANHSQRIGALWRWAYQEKLVDGPPTWRLEGNRSDD
jgi:site-specific recombinase XerD